MTRKLLIQLSAFLSVFILSSCIYEGFVPDEWAIEPSLELNTSGKIFSSRPGTDTVFVDTNYKEVSVSSNQPSWCRASVLDKNKAVIIVIDGNDSAIQRQATVTVSVKRGKQYLSKDYSVFQSGGRWDVIEGSDIRLRWSYDISESQEEIIKEQLGQFVKVDGGTFLMGSQNEDPTQPNYFLFADEDNPVHTVTLSSFYIGRYEVTQDQWSAIMENNPSLFKGGKHPVENITREETIEYARRLSQLTDLEISLPTSAQWEYAARGGQKSLGYLYSGSDNITEVAYYIDPLIEMGSPLYTSAPVGTKKPNELGIYDMSGNVLEMCLDWYGPVSAEPQVDPVGPNSGTRYVTRGGAFYYYSLFEVYRVFQFFRPSDSESVGLRLVLKQ